MNQKLKVGDRVAIDRSESTIKAMKRWGIFWEYQQRDEPFTVTDASPDGTIVNLNYGIIHWPTECLIKVAG